VKHFINLTAPGIRRLMPYQPGKPIEELQREYGVQDVIKLASNENPLGSGPRVLEVIQSQLHELSRYPDGNGFALKNALSQKLGVEPGQITLGNGSSEVLELLARAFLTHDDEVIYSQHAFAMYPIITQAVNAQAVVTPAKNWGHDLKAMQVAITDKTRLIFVANPNNPTGTWLGADELKGFIAGLPGNIIVVVDEAYFEYASDERLGARDYPDAMAWLNEFPNLVVTRTFSKAYGIAGLRVGYGVSNPEIADLLNRVRQPFNVNSLALAAATAALSDTAHLQRGLDCNVQGMRQLEQGIENLGLNYIPSVGNFISIDMGRDAAASYDALLHEGVIVRPVANYKMPHHLRVTVGTEAENAAFLRALEKVLQPA
jgi:histidinol-phosphate aminotransferase